MYLLDGMAIAPTDFYQKEHISIYEAMLQLRNTKRTIDVVTLSDQLIKNGTLEII